MARSWFLAALLTIGFAFAASSTATAGEVKVGDVAPDFTITSTVNTGGKPISLSDYAGKIVFLEFWFTT